MVAQFPTESSNSSAVDSFLIPKLDIFVNIQDVRRTEIIYGDNSQIVDNIPKSSRVVELGVKAKGIQIALIKPAIKRIFTYVNHAVINDMNITPTDKAYLPLDPYSIPTDNPRVNISIDADRIKRDKTINLELLILNLEANCINETFDRLSTYIEEAITTDLNPSI